MQNQDSVPTQGMDYRAGLKYLADVGSTYAKQLDKVAQDPFVACLNSALSAIQNTIGSQTDQIAKLKQEIARHEATPAPTENEA